MITIPSVCHGFWHDIFGSRIWNCSNIIVNQWCGLVPVFESCKFFIWRCNYLNGALYICFYVFLWWSMLLFPRFWFCFVLWLFFAWRSYICDHVKYFTLQEGRMRGQAFVTFPSVESAHHALVSISSFVCNFKIHLVTDKSEIMFEICTMFWNIYLNYVCPVSWIICLIIIPSVSF